MAREHALLLVSIWDDPDFIALEAMCATDHCAGCPFKGCPDCRYQGEEV